MNSIFCRRYWRVLAKLRLEKQGKSNAAIPDVTDLSCRRAKNPVNTSVEDPDPHIFGKPDTHQSENPDPQQSFMQDSDPHKRPYSGASKAKNRASGTLRICITFTRSWIRIRIKVKIRHRIRICIKVESGTRHTG
jgi:hypothetical protein